MPVGRCGNMYNINIESGYQLTKIIITGNFAACQGYCIIEVILVYITDSEKTGALIFKMSTAHTSNAYYTFCKLVAWSCISLSSKHMPWDNSKSKHGSCTLSEEVTSAQIVLFHNKLFNGFIFSGSKLTLPRGISYRLSVWSFPM